MASIEQKTGVHDPLVSLSRGTQFVLLVASSLVVMSGAMVAPAIGKIADVFVSPESELNAKLLLTLPALFIAIGSPLAGFVADRWGRKPLLIFALSLYGLSGGAAFFISSFMGLMISRAVLGLAISGVMTSATTLIGDLFDGEQRSRFLGIQSAFMGYAAVIFSFAGGSLSEIGWQMPFLAFFLGWLLLPMAWLHIDEPKKNVKTNIFETTSNKTSFPPVTYGIYLLTFIGMVMFYMLPVQVPFIFRETFKAGSFMFGVAIAATNLVAATVALFYNRVRQRFGLHMTFVFTFAFLAIGFLVVSMAGSLVMLFAGLLVAGVGLGFMFPNLSNWLIRTTPANLRGKVVGGFSTAVFLGQFLSPILLQPLLLMMERQTTFLVAAIVQTILVAGFSVFLLRKRNV